MSRPSLITAVATAAAFSAGLAFGAPAFSLIWGNTANIAAASRILRGTGISLEVSPDERTLSVGVHAGDLPGTLVVDLGSIARETLDQRVAFRAGGRTFKLVGTQLQEQAD